MLIQILLQQVQDDLHRPFFLLFQTRDQISALTHCRQFCILKTCKRSQSVKEKQKVLQMMKINENLSQTIIKTL